VAAALLAGSACLDERPRPSPPVLQVTLNQTEVTSPDTLTGTVRVEDRDGIDSVWVSLDMDRAGEDGFFEPIVIANFRFLVPAGLPPTTVLPVRLEARDIVGFRTVLDTIVTVVP
jgi:hypothetical protein